MNILINTYCYKGSILNPEGDYKNLKPACVIAEDRGWYTIALDDSQEFFRSQISGAFRHNATVKSDFPTVGDIVWVEHKNETPIIHAISPRINSLKRTLSEDDNEAQLLGANIDIIFICQPLDEQFNIKRLERLVWIAEQLEDAKSVILLTKSDVSNSVAKQQKLVKEHFPNIMVHSLSNKQPLSFAPVVASVVGNRAVLIGGSGAGKSSIVNVLLGDKKQKVAEVSQLEDKGRHTTVRREMFALPNGGCIIDTPGIRSIVKWDIGETNAHKAFDEIEQLGLTCKFTDCTHTNEPKCAVLEAVKSGSIDLEKLQSYQKLVKEEERLSMRPRDYNKKKKTFTNIEWKKFEEE